MLTRRLLVLIAVLIGLTALAAGVAPGDPAPTQEPPRAAPSPVQRATAAEDVVEETQTLSADADAGQRRISATRGQIVRLTVEGPVLDSVALGDLRIEPIDPESPARFELLAEEPAATPSPCWRTGRRIGVLEISG